MKIYCFRRMCKCTLLTVIYLAGELTSREGEIYERNAYNNFFLLAKV